MNRLATSAAIVAIALLPGCSDSDKESPGSGQLVEFREKLVFPAEPGEEPRILIDSTTTIDRDGRGELRNPVLFEGSREFEMMAPELARLERALETLDLAQLRRAYSEKPSDGSRLTLTYEGETVTVGRALLEKADLGEGEAELGDVLRPTQASRFMQVLGLIGAAGVRAIPEKSTDDLDRFLEEGPGAGLSRKARELEERAP